MELCSHNLCFCIHHCKINNYAIYAFENRQRLTRAINSILLLIYVSFFHVSGRNFAYDLSGLLGWFRFFQNSLGNLVESIKKMLDVEFYSRNFIF